MPVLRGIGEDFRRTKPFAGLRVALSVHLEAKTAYLCRVMEMGGAEMYVTGSNPLSTQDDVAAALAAGGMQVFARYGCDMEEYESCLCSVLELHPTSLLMTAATLSILCIQSIRSLSRRLSAAVRRQRPVSTA